MYRPFSHSSILLILLVIVLGVFSYRLSTQSSVRLEMEIPQHIVLDQNRSILPIPVRLTLYNRAIDAVVLQAANSCNILRWVIVGLDRRFIQAQGRPDQCSDAPQSLELAPDQTITANYVIPLDMARVAANTSYRLQIRFWHELAEQDFYLEAP